MSGFIGDPNRDRLDRLETAVDLILRELTPDALTPEARTLLDGILSGDHEALMTARRLMAEDPL